MIRREKIKVGNSYIEGLEVELFSKTFVLLVGSRGYIMCGYLNLNTAQKAKDVAVKVCGVSNIKEALGARVHSCTSYAKKLGINKGQDIKDVIRVIV